MPPFVSLLIQISAFSYNLAFFISRKLSFWRLIDNKTSCRPTVCDHTRDKPIGFSYHSYEFRLTLTLYLSHTDNASDLRCGSSWLAWKNRTKSCDWFPSTWSPKIIKFSQCYPPNSFFRIRILFFRPRLNKRNANGIMRLFMINPTFKGKALGTRLHD